MVVPRIREEKNGHPHTEFLQDPIREIALVLTNTGLVVEYFIRIRRLFADPIQTSLPTIGFPLIVRDALDESGDELHQLILVQTILLSESPDRPSDIRNRGITIDCTEKERIQSRPPFRILARSPTREWHSGRKRTIKLIQGIIERRLQGIGLSMISPREILLLRRLG